MNTKTMILLCSTALILNACASQKGLENRPPRDSKHLERLSANFINRWDYNEDGNATCDDILVQRSRLFKRLDEDNNGELNSREYRHARFEDKSFMFYEIDRIDGNGSTTVDLNEFIAVTHSQFFNIDKNADCTIDRQEALTAMRNNNPDAAQRKRGKGGRGKGKKRQLSPT